LREARAALDDFDDDPKTSKRDEARGHPDGLHEANYQDA